ncbi:hypothetical protein FH972_002818 [Carpinus fangiana]|uniref:Uncharacterized protein n=1 Tax=Carpinus fangiana TaxID=176857 RepID=A0A5N6QG15_9ROSI|nr:hypothetical protein FH972_002818 [Carpinus fangiana]
MNGRRGRGRPRKSSYNKDDIIKKNLNFFEKVIQKPRTKIKKERERLALRWSSHRSEILGDQLEKKENGESGIGEDLIGPTSPVNESTAGIDHEDIVIPGPIPDLDALYMDDSLFVNIFQTIPDFGLEM